MRRPDDGKDLSAEVADGGGSLTVQQLDVTVETKTLDNVFVHTVVFVGRGPGVVMCESRC